MNGNVSQAVNTENEIEINLGELFGALINRIIPIALVSIFGAVIAFIFTSFFITPLYSSSSMIYILSKSTSVTSLSDIQLSAQLTEDYQVLALSRPVITEVIDTLGLDYGYEELIDIITVVNPADTHVLKFIIEHENPQLAADIADSLSDVVAERVANVMQTDKPTIVERAVVEEDPTSPNKIMNTAIGFMVGVVLSCAIVIIRFITDDTIKTEDDVMKYLGENIFAEVPINEAVDTNSKSKALKKKNSQKEK